MPNGRGPYPCLRIQARAVKGLRDLGPDYDPWVYFFEATLSLRAGADAVRRPFPFRLDTMASVSMVPDSWRHDDSRLFGRLSRRVRFDTAAGRRTGQGRMAREVLFAFPGHPGEYPTQLLVAETLDGKYGLLALRDLLKHFSLRTSGPFNAPGAGGLGVLGVVDLVPRH